ncbi:hypothetical protein B0H14DRAFT_2599232 [Mycena olivaceomarginata]|nr:hypothetical protein B0H14DRAFT_2599232 [Mycena olivaceomarginata]
MTSTLPGSSNFLKPVRQSKADASAQQAKVAEHRRLRAEQQAQLRSLENKRDQWRAASARYYERHPEMKEKKRLKMAEKRAAKKTGLAAMGPTPSGRAQKKLGDFSEVLDLNLSPDGDRFLPTHECVFRWDRVSTNNYVPSDVLEMFIESIYEPSQRYVYPERTLD